MDHFVEYKKPLHAPANDTGREAGSIYRFSNSTMAVPMALPIS